MAKRRNCADQFKAKVALEALCGDKTVQEIAAKHQLQTIQFSGAEQNDYNHNRPHSSFDGLTPQRLFVFDKSSSAATQSVQVVFQNTLTLSELTHSH